MLVLEILALCWLLVMIIGFSRVVSELYSIHQWIAHVNQKLSVMEKGSPQKREVA